MIPVVFAVLQKRVSVSARAVRAHICIPACHGASGDVILQRERNKVRGRYYPRVTLIFSGTKSSIHCYSVTFSIHKDNVSLYE